MKPQFYRIRSASDIAISLTLIIAGIALMFYPTGIGITILGMFLFLIGSLFLCLLKSVYRKEGTKETYKKRKLQFRREILQTIRDAVLSDPNLIDMTKEGMGWTVKLNIYYNRKTDKGYIQLYEYIPYNYEPRTQMLEYRICQIEKLLNKKKTQ